jgi:Ca-activated chloride channel homolog
LPLRSELWRQAPHSSPRTLGIYEADDPDNDKPREVLQQLAKASGGEAFFPDTLSEVQPICERIARDIRNQYSISYVPSNQRQDGGYRTIRVRTSKSGATVITRAGYVAAVVNTAGTPPAPRSEKK